MDLKDSIQLVQQSAVEAAGARNKIEIVKLPGEPDYVYGVVKATGELERREAAAAPRKHQLLGVDQVGVFVEDMENRLECQPTVWYAPSGVRVVLDDHKDLNRYGGAVVPLVFTPQWTRLKELEKGIKLGQKEFVRLLKNHLVDCMTDDLEKLLRSVRTLNFSSNRSGSGTINQGRESLGLSIEAEIASTVGPIPETVALQVRVYTDPSLILRRQILCSMEADASDNTLCLTPLPLQLDNALQDEMEHLHRMLEGAVKVPVFYGVP
ncbi:MAG: hypothetical protein E6Q97_30425 [Desulfurellales bacterium]|nr:MAG: hypothetical protein E6Q97_30425 [Desulfurellales bacterium]